MESTVNIAPHYVFGTNTYDIWSQYMYTVNQSVNEVQFQHAIKLQLKLKKCLDF